MRNVFGTILLLGPVLGCSTAPPGAGFTNGGAAPTKSEEKPALRTDMPAPAPAVKGEILGPIDDGATLPAPAAGGAKPAGGAETAPSPKPQ